MKPKRRKIILSVFVSIFIFLLLGVIFIAIVLRGYSNIPKPSYEKVVPLNATDYPVGWHFASVESDNDWHADYVYRVHFESVQPDLSSFVDFVHYSNPSDASKAYTDNRGRAFWWVGPLAISDWALPSDITKRSKVANQSEIACTIQRGQIEICTFWAQYNKCLIKFTSQIGDKLMSHSDFEDLITTIDNREKDSDVCMDS